MCIWHVLTKVEGRHVGDLKELGLRVASVLLSERLEGVSLLGAAHLLITSASGGVLDHSDDFFVLIVQCFKHLTTGLGRSLSGLAKDLRVGFHHAFLLGVSHGDFLGRRTRL